MKGKFLMGIVIYLVRKLKLNKKVLVLVSLMILFDLSLHVFELVSGKPPFYHPDRFIYNIFWTTYWGVGLIALGFVLKK